MIFYKLITKQVLKESDMKTALGSLKALGIECHFDGFEHIK